MKKTELLLGRSETARFRNAFDKADNFRRGRLTAAEAARAYGGSLGGKATKTEVIPSTTFDWCDGSAGGGG